MKHVESAVTMRAHDLLRIQQAAAPTMLVCNPDNPAQQRKRVGPSSAGQFCFRQGQSMNAYRSADRCLWLP
jgi:hypothetical protein